MKNRKTTTTPNVEHHTSNSPTARTARLKKPHPCGGSEFTIIREGPMMTLRCATCGSFVRLSREMYEKAAISDR